LIRPTLFVMLMTLFLCETPVFSETPPAGHEEVVKKIQKVYSQRCCFRAHFDQLTVNVSMDMKDKFSGIMYVKKPGMIALDVQSPEKQNVIVQGRSYTVLFPEEGNAASGEIPQEMNVEQFFGFFANIGNIEKNFSITVPAKSQEPAEKLLFLELTDLKNPKSLYSILLGIDMENFTVRRAIIYDALGNYNRFDLSRITFLESLPDSMFQMPAGTKSQQNPSFYPVPSSETK
jgi:outer membrane lipoprotein-sorting protein